ncbi:MAG: ribosome small subunit-dependent GTPase A [Acidobacteria bacterium]|nr:ribosome small subunit-dependent GTPase A [Acidobacteriota bacterium]
MKLSPLGWSEDFTRARIASETRGHYQLWTADGEYTARLPGAWRDERPVAGDWVLWDPDTGLVEALLPRRTRISRKKAGRVWEEQVLAANVDVVFIVTALDHDFNLRRLERYLVAVEGGGAAAVIVLNKADLPDDLLVYMRQVDRLAPSVPVLLMSALDRGSVAQLHRSVEPGQTAVLVGSSGVGKSTIVNSLLGGELQLTRAVREHDSRGRHATTSRQMFLLDAGWLLIDTPGLRELEPWAGPEAAAAVFEDIQTLAVQCRFRDCRHQGEPGCAVQAAVHTGEMDAVRLASFHKLERELARLERMSDVHAAREHKRKWKQIHKAMRRMPKR